MNWEPKPGQLVRLVGNPAKIGTVTDQTRPRKSGPQYRVNWNGNLRWHYASQLIPADIADNDVYKLIREGRYGRVEELHRLLIHVHLTGRLANVVYAMGLTQTEFYPHQYKPLLTLLDSPVNGLLIADEVGLGKTIEAGLIWTELRARYNMRKLLVVCPAMLCEKWRLELSSRFGLDPRIVNAGELLSELGSNSPGERAWIISYQGIRVPKGWKSEEGDMLGRSPRIQLANLLSNQSDLEPLVDLIIFDEAHYMRNDSTSTWKTGSLLREVTTHQLMLSATPINLESGDLFNLLRLLDPDHFERREDFSKIEEANRPVIAASDAVRDQTKDTDYILNEIRKLRSSRWFEHSERVDRLIEEAETVDDWSDDVRVDIAAKLERLSLLAHIVNRTRKREVQAGRVIRDPRVFKAEMSPTERELYEAITEGTREYALENDIKHGFLLSTPQRMVASCPAALLRTWRDAGLDADGIVVAMDDSDEDEETVKTSTSSLKSWLGRKVLPHLDHEDLYRDDSKFSKFLEVLKTFLADDQEAKCLIFTTYRGTARYLVERLSAENIEAGLLMGGTEFDKEAVVSDFRDSSQCRILVCTDVAAEGVDLQFCRLVVNYDLPWNPMRIEQRIGRIDRIGQQSDRILIWNFVHSDTIDERILSRLAERIGIFVDILGATEEILGQVRKLEDLLLSSKLTAEEEQQRIDQTAFAITNSMKEQERLENEAIHLVAHGQQLMSQIQAAAGEGKNVTRDDLIRYVDGCFRTAPGCQLISKGGGDIFEITLSSDLAVEMDEYLRSENLLGKTRVSSGQPQTCRFTDRITEKPKPGEEIVHRFHPIIGFLSQKTEKEKDHFPLYACKVSNNELEDGQYVLVARLASFSLPTNIWARTESDTAKLATSSSGVKNEAHLLVAAIPIRQDEPLDDSQAESLLDCVRGRGVDWPTAAANVNAEDGVMAAEQCDELLIARYDALKSEKSRENQDRADVLLQLLEDHIKSKKEGFETRIANHEASAAMLGDNPNGKRRKGLAEAERAKQKSFLVTMDKRRSSLRMQKESFTAETQEICVILIEVISGV